MASAWRNVPYVISLLLVINLCDFTSSSLQDFENHETDASRAARSIDDGRTSGSQTTKGVEKMNGKVADKQQQQHQHAAKNGRSNVFSTVNSTIVWAQIGGTASLPCVVRKNSGTVLWLRQWPSATPTLLSVGVNKHTADDRYYVEHIRHLQNWGLVIKHVHGDDEGVYKCQVSTHPPTIILIHLKVTEAYAEIVGAPDLHLRAGSELHLDCQIRQATEPPEYVFWYHEDRMINYDEGVQAVTNLMANVLIVHEANKSHDGNYTCKPSNAVPAHINVHVLNATEEENPAAMLHSNSATNTFGDPFQVCILLIISIVYLTSNRR